MLHVGPNQLLVAAATAIAAGIIIRLKQQCYVYYVRLYQPRCCQHLNAIIAPINNRY
jgi:hypothetical protein